MTGAKHRITLLERSELTRLDVCAGCVMFPYQVRTRVSTAAKFKTDRFYSDRAEAMTAYKTQKEKERV